MPDFLQSQKDLVVNLFVSAIKGEVIVNNIRGAEALSELFEFQVNFSSADRELNAEKILGTNATIHFKSEEHERFIDGIITQFSQGTTSLKEDIYLTEYFFTMRPKLWLLSLDNNCKMFQNKSAMDIIKSVLKDNKISDISNKTSKCGSGSREYCVQYNESSFNFISRLMEDEGIFYYFDHEKGKHTLVITDSANSYRKLKKDAEFIKTNHEICPLGKVFNISKNTFMNVGGYSLADYNYENSQAKLFSKLNTKWKGNTFYEYPGGFSKASEGEALSKLRVQEIESRHMLLQGDSTIPDFAPGATFNLKLHHAESFNDSYILYRVEHIFDRTEKNGFVYRNRFLALPKGTEFRAPRKTPKPKIYGNQTAAVVCPSGKEIYRNKHCCVKVHFHWDQEGKSKDTNDSSCWIRVAQLLSGSNWGAVYVPRVGQEVVVSFLEGDPDRPLIVGCVYNDQFMPPYSESQDKISTMKTVTFTDDSKYNEIRFNDEKEKEEIFVHAQKDMNIDIVESRKTKIEEKNDTLDILNGSSITKLHSEKGKKGIHSLEIVKGDKSVLLKEGDSKYTMKKGNSTIELDNGNSSITLKKGNSEIILKKGNSSVKLQKGNQTIDINGDCTIKIKGNLKIKADKNITIQAGKELSLKSGTAMKAKAGTSFTAKAGTSAKIQSGTSFTCKAGTSMTIKSTMSMSIKANATMNIKSMGMLKAEGMALTNITGVAVQINGKGVSSFRAPMLTIGGGMISFG
ncbi:MAG: type VI secretion system tip protein VgrG [Alphaproteobacteria bacterium]|nr:type VI secretion system tip protein VgrG [Alphaproteobacteria bacterium]